MGEIVFHFPLLIIFLPMLAAVAMPLLRNGRLARIVTISVLAAMVFMALGLTIWLWISPMPYFIYLMGYFPAPWGNELRAGMLEALLSIVFAAVMLFSVLGTKQDLDKDIGKNRLYLYYCMINLLSCALMALVFTNDIFNAYVFIEISTIAACSIVVAKESGETLKATVKYLFLSVMGSGLFLLATAILYSITGHLLMSNANEVITTLVESGEYTFPLLMTLLLFIVSIAVKAALFPFHMWLPDAHASATTASSAILSGLVLKGYVVLLIKLLYRVYGIETIETLGVLPVLFILGVTGMMAGSVMACFQTKLKRLVAYSSVGQIGYIFMGMGLSNQGGFTAASFHIIGHSFTKSMLFIAAGALINAAGSYDIAGLTGAARKNKIAGAAFIVGALSMAGIPLFAGFVSKFYLASAAVHSAHNLWITLLALAVSAFLSGVYYFPVLVRLCSKEEGQDEGIPQAANAVGSHSSGLAANVTFICLIIINVALGLFFVPLLSALESGFLALT
jgi:multicomponent Na+:H+ antiporter subunit D